MVVNHLDDGRTVADTAGMHALSGRRHSIIRVVCRAYRGTDGYDVAACGAALDEHPMDAVLVTAAQAHTYLGIPPGTIWSWVSRGQLTPVDRAGRAPRYAVTDLTALRDRDTPAPSTTAQGR